MLECYVSGLKIDLTFVFVLYSVIMFFFRIFDSYIFCKFNINTMIIFSVQFFFHNSLRILSQTILIVRKVYYRNVTYNIKKTKSVKKIIFIVGSSFAKEKVKSYNITIIIITMTFYVV